MKVNIRKQDLKEVFKTDDYKFDLDESSDDSNMYKAMLSNEIILFDYNGKKLDEINSNSKTSYNDLRCKDLFCEIEIDNKTYIYNLKEGKRIITLDGENYINTHKGDILSVYLQNNKYNVYKNDKLILDGVEASNGLDILDDGFAARNSTYTLYDNDGNVVDDTVFFYKDTKNYLKKDINLWIKYNSLNKIYIIGHLHKSFNINEVEGITGDYIESIDKLTNIEIVDSAGCTYDEYVSYMILEINKDISIKRIKVKFDRKKFIDKIMNLDFPDKNNILKYFYGIESLN